VRDGASAKLAEFNLNRTRHERVMSWTEGVSSTYESTDAPMMKLARNRWSVRAEGERSLVTSEAEIAFRGGVLGWLLGWIFVPIIRLLLPKPLAKFKYWVEHGRPFSGKASKLPSPPAVC
jgi:hypothetical protein